MTNQAPFFFHGEGNTGRFFLSPYHMMEAKHQLEIENSRAKRGERKALASKWKQHAWGCGCCVDVLEHVSDQPYAVAETERINRINRKRARRRHTFFEIDGKRLAQTVLSNGSVVVRA